MAGKGAALAWRVVGLGSAIAAGVAARKVAVTGWKLATGSQPPVNPEAPDVSVGEAVGWAVASGAIVGVARLLATRKVADYWQRSTGALPPGMEKVTP
ncbi:DUF4235 domain-containing protein [Vallicoccus soli]|uniref:DUF4235 domain-containing protein n=1 Tax=Vallicoccus soli TaxID=2339232 RepID=A0A3A3YSF7_9ACTN|nr:DUF4235 domain-containing protein [Vallicoccus soli]RJK94281.1 DUF4235 domain-containing protein [Vallicoccus soli]